MTKQSFSEELKHLRKLWTGFMPSRVLLTANNLRVFDHLTTECAPKELSGKLKTDQRATELLLDALTAMGLLRKKKGRYKNSRISNRFLVSSSPLYQGNIIRHAHFLWQSWSELDGVLKTGRPVEAEREIESFIKGMDDIAKLRCKEVIDRIPLRGVKKALDLGGGPGTYSMELAKRGIGVTLFDRPETLKIAKGLIKERAIDGIDFLAGDFMKDPIGKGYDLVFVSQILHAYSDKENIRLLRKIKGALNPGGKVVVQEFYLNSSKTAPLWGALFSINMLLNTTGGRTYSTSEIKGWLKRAGFKTATSKRLDETVIIIGK